MLQREQKGSRLSKSTKRAVMKSGLTAAKKAKVRAALRSVSTADDKVLRMLGGTDRFRGQMARTEKRVTAKRIANRGGRPTGGRTGGGNVGYQGGPTRRSPKAK